MARKGIATDFGKGSVPKLILRQALPLMLSSLVQLLYNIVDRVYIGHIPGDGQDALTGLGLTFPVVSAILAFTMLFGQGGAPDGCHPYFYEADIIRFGCRRFYLCICRILSSHLRPWYRRDHDSQRS